MEDRELLQAILEKVTSMDERLSHVEKDTAEIRDDLQSLKADVSQIPVMQDSIGILIDGMTGMNEKFKKLDMVAEDVAEIKIKVTALETVTRDNTSQIRDLKMVK